MDQLPELALSVRQPWAFAIIHGGKDIENRSWRRPNPGLAFRGRVCIHASSGMTRDEYEEAESFMRMYAVACPPAHELMRGGVIGMVDVIDVVRDSASHWFFGPVGLLLRKPVPVEPIPCKGQLGFFRWRDHLSEALTPPAKWMLPKEEQLTANLTDKLAVKNVQGSLI